MQKNWKVIVVDPSERGLHLLYVRTQLEGLGSIAKNNLSLVSKKMEEFTFPSDVDFISAQASLPYCEADKVVALWDKIHLSLAKNGYFAADFFNSCSYDEPLIDSDTAQARILDDDKTLILLKNLTLEYTKEFGWPHLLLFVPYSKTVRII